MGAPATLAAGDTTVGFGAPAGVGYVVAVG
jgi:hypothetical protein